MNLLISVKNVQEAMIAFNAGVDMIDLKNPDIGALGALSLDVSQQIVQKIRQNKVLSPHQFEPVISATIGENHMNTETFLQQIEARVDIGIDIIKIAISDLLDNAKLLTKYSQRAKLVAVFFADELIDFEALNQLKRNGFYGAMLDTQKKQQNLFECCALKSMQIFIQKCDELDLKSGLAGSLKPLHIDYLADINPSYIGFRGGVCQNNLRKNTLNADKVIHLKKLLQEHNKFKGFGHPDRNIALHS